MSIVTNVNQTKNKNRKSPLASYNEYVCFLAKE